MKKKFIFNTLVVLSLIFTSLGCNSITNKDSISISKEKVQSNMSIQANSNNEVQNQNADFNNNDVNSSELSIICVGDILFHLPEVVSAQNNDTYDFKPMFSEVKEIVSSKDIAVANFETTINPKKNISGYPCFNTPVEALDALKDTGFQILLNDHNHTLDTGIEGLRSTNKFMKQYGFKVLGSGDPDEDKSLIIDKNGIKVGMLSYTYSTNFGIQYKDMINYIDIDKIKSEMEIIRPKCDYLIVFLHLGTEYVRTVEPFQADLVKKVANLNADAILCSHPHVAKKTEILKHDGKETLVNYSMGNFISNQNDKYTDIGSMQSIVIKKINGITRLKSTETIPVYRLRYSNYGKTIYKTVPEYNINKFKNILSTDTVSYITQTSNELSFNYLSPEIWRQKNNMAMSRN